MSLKSSAISGVKWTTTSMVIVTILQLLQLSILARYLDPTDFGLMAILMVVIGFSQAFMDMGVSNAIIHRQKISNSQLSSLYWLNIISGTLLALLVIVLAPLIASFYEEARLNNLLIILSSVFIIVSLGNQYRILCQKELLFNLMAKIEVVTASLSFIVAVYFAYSGWGVYALVFSMLTQALTSSILFLYVGLKNHHVPTFSYKHSEMKGFYSFGLFQMGEKSVNYISANIDKLLIGKMVGFQAVGFYNMAWQLIIFPLAKINPVVNKVAFPVYAKVQNDPKALNRYYSLSVKILSLLTVPILAFLSFFANDVVLIVFGKGWEQTALLVTVLAFVGIGKALGNPGGALILALGRADVGFWWNVFWASTVSVTLFIVLSYFQTVEAVAFTLLALSVTVGVIWHVLIAKIGRISYLGIFLHFSKVVVVTITIAWFAKQSVHFAQLEAPILRILLAGVVCFMLYAPYLFLVEKPLFKSFKKD
ncbi:MOP flippase family protein [Pseudoalteromonas sp. SCSIO 43095]|uniref:MOP flippase family protein n=1 Tax=Pseudoalteromonas sp. SCSIO 43095 TaxID=2894202 RepID=UPI00202B1728|nr:MOP flippase family protein [Pseudoalteromonas sp. SCSIO 43095]URQ99026.1 MOP flippase family protein [Pseudoalteromonas sp. SCSIO 43095]